MPLSGDDQVVSFANSLKELLSGGKGAEVFREFITSPVRPSKNLMDAAVNMLKGKQEFVLLEDQLTSSNSIFGMVEKAIKNPSCKMALIVKGGPGTGKTVIALHVIAELASRYSVKGTDEEVYTCRFKRLASKDGALFSYLVL